MDEACKVEPVMLGILLAERLGRLERMNDLGRVGVGVTLVNNLLEHLEGVPDIHGALVQLQVALANLLVEFHGLEPSVALERGACKYTYL